MTRQPVATYPAERDDIGQLVTRRPLPNRQIGQIGPFLFLNHHGPQTYPPGNSGLPFGPHPHRGFETVTFILEGSLSHLDTGGHESVIHAGGVQWMTAGSGLVHAELSPEEFKQSGGPLEILQLWVNLPARLKMTAPNYIGLQATDIPKVSLGEGITAEVISGELNGTAGPVESLTGLEISVLRLEKGAKLDLPVPREREIFFYLVSGEVISGGRTVPEYQLVRFDRSGDSIQAEATQDSVVLFGHGEPINEPVVAHGPFVMNAPDEIRQAIMDYQAGKFGSF